MFNFEVFTATCICVMQKQGTDRELLKPYVSEGTWTCLVLSYQVGCPEHSWKLGHRLRVHGF